MTYIGFPILSLIYIVIFLCLYYSKKRINLFENKIVISMMFLNCIGLLLELGCYLVLSFLKIQDTFLGMFILKNYIVYIFIFNWLLTGYIFILTNNKRNSDFNIKKYFYKIILLFLPMTLIEIIITYFLPLNYCNEYPKFYTYGVATNTLLISFIILLPIWIFKCIFSFISKKNNNKNVQVSVLFFGILLSGIAGAITQFIDHSVLIITSVHSIVLTLIYFTIENPDIKMIEQLRQNKRLIEKSNEDKSNFLFRMSQEVRKPIDDIIRVNNIITNTDEKETIDKGIKYIDYNAKQLKVLVNDVLDISKMDTYNIKMIESTYNVYNVFTEITSRFDNMINDKVEFRYSISKNIPKILYGDAVKIKQVVTTVLQNSVDYTKVGYIDMNVDSIVKNDVCRLIITIEDSGIGISLDKINELLSLESDIQEEDIKKLEGMNLDLNIALKITRLLGGQILIKSEENKGSEFIIVIEQKIKKIDNQTIKDKQIEEYSKTFLGKKRVLVVTDKKEDLINIASCLKNYNIDIFTSMYGSDCVDRIKQGQKYDLIILEDEMQPKTGINTLQELKLINKFKTPVIIILDKNKEAIKHHYIEEGFKNYILKEDIENELNRIIKLI